MKRCLVALLALGVAFTVSAQSGGEELFLPKKTKIVQGPIQLSRNVTGVLTAKVMLNGKPVKLMVDTGATHTTLDKNYLQKHFPNLRILPMKFSGETNIQAALSCAKVDSLKVGKSEFNDFYAIVIPMEHFVESLEGEEVAGILGMNVLAQKPFRFSVRDTRLAWFNETPENSRSIELPVAPAEGSRIFTLNAQLEGASTPFTIILDSGANNSILDANVWANAKSVSARTADVNVDKARDFKQGTDSRTLILGELKIPMNQPLLRSNQPALLGTDVMRNFDIIVDGAAHRVWALPHLDKAPAKR